MLVVHLSRKTGRIALAAVVISVGAFSAAAVSPDLVAATSPTPPPRPVITGVLDPHGPAVGGNTVRVVGSNLNLLGSRVAFGTDWYGSVTATTSGTATIVAPAGAAGVTVDLVGPVSTPGGWGRPQNADPADDYTYDGPTRRHVTPTPSHGPAAGGNRVTVTGDGIDFSRASKVEVFDPYADFFSRPTPFRAGEIVEKTSSSVTFIAPWGRPLNATKRPWVQVTGADGRVDGFPGDEYRYDPGTGLPTISSIAPSRTYARGNLPITLTGTGFEDASDVLVNGAPAPFELTGDGPNASLTVTVLPGFPVGPGTVLVRTPLGDSAPVELTFLDDRPAPVITAISPASGSVAGGTRITIEGTDLDETSSVFFSSGQDPYFATDIEVLSSERVRVTTPRVPAAGPYKTFLTTDGGGSNRYEAESPGDDFTFVEAPLPVSQDFSAKGAATIKTLAAGALALAGRLDLSLWPESGTGTGDLALNKTTGRLTALGFLPVTATLTFTQTAPVQASLTQGKLTLKARMRIKLPSVKLFGLELVAGANCQTKQVSAVTLTSGQSTFGLGGGAVSGGFTVSDLTGCGALTGIVSPLTKGSANVMALDLTPTA